MIPIAKIYNKRVAKSFSKVSDKVVCNDTMIGIEFELEGIPRLGEYAEKGFDYWTEVKDNSLRNNGREFISGYQIADTVVPIQGNLIIEALAEFEGFIKYLAEGNIIPEESSRTSTHIHIYVGDLSQEELYRYTLLYSMFEKPLFRFCEDDTRYWNNYCVPIGINQSLVNQLGYQKHDILGSARDFKNFIHFHTAKYDGMNLNSIEHKGTVEFRMMKGCVDVVKILDWINILLSMKLASKKTLDIPTNELMSHISKKGIEVFAKSIFSDGLYNLLVYPGFERDILVGLRLAQEIEFKRDLFHANMEVLNSVGEFNNEEFSKKLFDVDLPNIVEE